MSQSSNGISFTNPEVVKQLYKMGDKNQDGTIDENEFKEGLTQMGLPPALANAGWNIGDKNHDGKLDLDEAITLGRTHGKIGDKYCQGALNGIFGGAGGAVGSAAGPSAAIGGFKSVSALKIA